MHEDNSMNAVDSLTPGERQTQMRVNCEERRCQGNGISDAARRRMKELCELLIDANVASS